MLFPSETFPREAPHLFCSPQFAAFPQVDADGFDEPKTLQLAPRDPLPYFFWPGATYKRRGFSLDAREYSSGPQGYVVAPRAVKTEFSKLMEFD